MAETATLQSAVARIFSEKLMVHVPDPDTDLVEAGLLDSLMFVDLLLHLERDLNVSVALETLDLDHFRSIKRIVEFIAASDPAGATVRPEPEPVPSHPLSVGPAQSPSIA
jgi:acyl carrier protein